MREMFGSTKLGFVSTVLSIVGAILVGAGSIGTTMNNNALVKNEVAKAAAEAIAEQSL